MDVLIPETRRENFGFRPESASGVANLVTAHHLPEAAAILERAEPGASGDAEGREISRRKRRLGPRQTDLFSGCLFGERRSSFATSRSFFLIGTGKGHSRLARQQSAGPIRPGFAAVLRIPGYLFS